MLRTGLFSTHYPYVIQSLKDNNTVVVKRLDKEFLMEAKTETIIKYSHNLIDEGIALLKLKKRRSRSLIQCKKLIPKYLTE